MRSGRLPDAQIVRLYGGVLAMVGADAFVLGELRAALGERLVIYKPALCPAICRLAAGVNGIFADSAALSEFVQGQGLVGEPEGLAGMAFSAAPPPGGQKVDRLWIYYSLYDQVGWDWDAAAGAFLRSQEARLPDGGVALEPLVDRLTGQQLAFGNVVLLIAYHEELKPALIDIHLSHPQSGGAWVLRWADLPGLLPRGVARRASASLRSAGPALGAQAWEHLVHDRGPQLHHGGRGARFLDAAPPPALKGLSAWQPGFDPFCGQAFQPRRRGWGAGPLTRASRRTSQGLSRE
jgi:hypothetical protein